MKQLVVYMFFFIGLQGICQAQNQDKSFTIYLVRHAEKAWSFNPFNPLLTECGRLRAVNLQRLMKDTGIKDIYSTDYKRTMATAGQTANAHGLTIQHYDSHKLEAFSQLLLDGKQDALIVGHSETTSVLAGMLVEEDRAALDGSEYDYLYQVVIDNAKRRIEVRRQEFLCNE